MSIRKTVTFFCLLLISATLSGSISSAAKAGEKELVSFFHALEHRWEGKGRTQSFAFDGSTLEDLRFEMELEIEKEIRETIWSFEQEIKRENSTVVFDSFNYNVVGDRLLVSNVHTQEPVELVLSQSDALVYRFERYEWWSRRVYHFEISLQLANQRLLNGARRVTLNGAVVEQQEFQLKRR